MEARDITKTLSVRLVMWSRGRRSAWLVSRRLPSCYGMCLQTSHAYKLSIRGKTKVALTKQPCPACLSRACSSEVAISSSCFTSWDFDCCLIGVMALAMTRRARGSQLIKSGSDLCGSRLLVNGDNYRSLCGCWRCIASEDGLGCQRLCTVHLGKTTEH